MSGVAKSRSWSWSRSLVVVSVLALASACGGGSDGGGGVDARPAVDGSVFPDSVTVDGGGADAITVDAAPTGLCGGPAALTTPSQSGSTAGRGPSVYEGDCAFGESGPEIAYAFTAPISGTLSVELNSDADLGVYLMTECGNAATELTCADDDEGGAPEFITYEVVSGTTYYVLVDGFTAAEEGAFTLEARVTDFAGQCAAATAVTASTSGTTVGGSLDFAGSCTGASAPSAIYAYTPGVTGETGDVTITLTSTADLGVYLRETCADPISEFTCSDTEFAGTNEVLRVAVTGGVPMSIFVDGFVPGAASPHTLDVAYTAATCGNGVREGLEACDAVGLPTATCSIACAVLTPPTETNCNDLTDEDGDDAYDCRDTDCIAQCTPGAGLIATACAVPSDCTAAGNDPLCLDEVVYGWPAGHCSQYCDSGSPDIECGTGNVCLSLGVGTLGVCMKGGCTDPVTDCPGAGYMCRTLTAGGDVCWPGCTLDAQCPNTGHCDVPSGFCAPPEVCTNGVDDDFDGHADCADIDCAGLGACPANVEAEPNDTSATATAYVASYAGAITPAGDTDVVSVVVAAAGSTIEAKVHDGGGTDCPNSLLDTAIEILGPDGTTRLAFNEDMGTDNWCSRATATGLAAGTYYVRVEASAFASTDTFAYRLDVVLTP